MYVFTYTHSSYLYCLSRRGASQPSDQSGGQPEGSVFWRSTHEEAQCYRPLRAAAGTDSVRREHLYCCVQLYICRFNVLGCETFHLLQLEVKSNGLNWYIFLFVVGLRDDNHPAELYVQQFLHGGDEPQAHPRHTDPGDPRVGFVSPFNKQEGGKINKHGLVA